jgi:flagellar hook-associated protein 2
MSYDVEETKLTGTSKVSQFLGDIFKDGAQEDENGKYITYNLTVGSETKEIKIYENQSMNDFASAIQTASGGKVNASFDVANQRFFLTSTSTGAANNFSLEATAGSSASEAALQKLGLIENTEYTGSNAMASHAATDAEIELNGAVITSATNDISVSGLGLTISVGGAKEGEDLTIDVNNDTDGVYDMIKDFFKEYNNLLADMNEMYYAEKTDYEPLTDDEEDAMTETQIEKWETKVKASVLRNDDRLNTLLSSMRTILTSAVTVNNSDGSTSKLSLASFGVTTGEWTEYGLMHIAGDEDDAEYSDKTNKLKNALESDPDKVMNTFAQVMTKMYDKITSMSKSSTTRTYGNVYNDKTMKSQLEDYDDEIETLQDKLTTMQDKYYSQFSAMEVALSKLNSTASSLGFSSTSS